MMGAVTPKITMSISIWILESGKNNCVPGLDIIQARETCAIVTPRFLAIDSILQSEGVSQSQLSDRGGHTQK